MSPDGHLVATPSSGGIAIWNARTGRVVTNLPSQTTTEPAEFNHDGTRVLTTSYDETARMWDTQSGKQLAIFSGHHDVVNSAAFSADDRFVTTASWDGTARVWEADTGRPVATLPVKVSDAVVGFGTGRTVAVADNGVVRIMTCDVCRSFAALLRLAERRAIRRLTPQERHEFLH
jgi:WD40 repeat protein